MADSLLKEFMNDSESRYVKIEQWPIEEDAYRRSLLPEGHRITQENWSSKTVKVKWSISMNLTEERIKALCQTEIKPIKLHNKKKDLLVNKHKEKEEVMCILNIADFHLNRKVWGKAGFGQDYTIELAEKTFKGIIDEAYLQIKESGRRVSRIVLNTGGDFLNTDTVLATTTRGTQQINDIDWRGMYDSATMLLSYAIMKLSELAKVEYYYIPGNHDVMVSYFLTSWLKAKFDQPENNVLIDDNPQIRQVVLHKKNMIVLAHGDTEGQRAIDLPFNDPKAREHYSNCVNVEVLTGHIHHTKVITSKGVRWETLACSCPVGDAWSYDSAFNTDRCEATINYYGEERRVQQDYIDTKKIFNDIVSENK